MRRFSADTVSLLAGRPVATLQSDLAVAQQAYVDLSSGSKVVSATPIAQGAGSRSVTYTPADMGALQNLIRSLQQAARDYATCPRTYPGRCSDGSCTHPGRQWPALDAIAAQQKPRPWHTAAIRHMTRPDIPASIWPTGILTLRRPMVNATCTATGSPPGRVTWYGIDGWASGAVTRILDNQIGGNFRPMFKPDYKALALRTGIKAFDSTWAHEYAQVLAANYRTWSEGPGHYADAQRHQTMIQLMRLAFRHKLIDGDALAQLVWLPERVGPGRASYSTAVQLIDPDRLSNPQLQFDTQIMRGGVVVDQYGAAEGYYIRRAHQGDWWSAAESQTWDLIPRETPWGRPIIVHDFDPDRAGQHKGGTGIFTPILARMKMLAKMDGVELDAAVVNAVFGAYIESPYDHSFGRGSHRRRGRNWPVLPTRKNAPTSTRSGVPPWVVCGFLSYFRARKLTRSLPHDQTPTLPGFKIPFCATSRHRRACRLNSFRINWSDVNYSSARAAMLEAYKTMGRRHYDYTHRFASPVTNAWHEESRDVDEYPLPRGAPDFEMCRAEYGRMVWMKPPRGWIDPVAERTGRGPGHGRGPVHAATRNPRTGSGLRGST